MEFCVFCIFILDTIIGGGGGSLEKEKVESYGFYHDALNIHHWIRIEISKNTLQWECVNLEGKIVDKFALNKS